MEAHKDCHEIHKEAERILDVVLLGALVRLLYDHLSMSEQVSDSCQDTEAVGNPHMINISG